MEPSWEAAVAAVFAHMQSKNVPKCDISYSGWGDSGAISSWDPELRLPKAVHTVIEAKLFELLGEHYPGWEIDSGSDGFLRFNRGKMQVELHHTDQVEVDRKKRPFPIYAPPTSKLVRG